MSQGNRPVLVAGATGSAGRAVLEALIGQGAPVRAMGRRDGDRDGTPAGVPVAVADFDDEVLIAAALRGAGRAYLVTPSSERAGPQQRCFADLAALAGVGHLVVLSQLASAEDSPVRFLRYHAEFEGHVRGLGSGFTFLCLNLFFQAAAGVRRDGRRPRPVLGADRRRAGKRGRRARHGAVAAVALTEPGHLGATYTLTGPAAITHQDIAAARW